MNGKLMRIVMLTFVLLGIVLLQQTPAHAQLTPGSGAEASLTDQHTQTLNGNFCFVTGGNSLILVDSADFTVNVPGQPIAAYWVWSARVIERGDIEFPDPVDNTLTVTGIRGDGTPFSTEITATIQEQSTYNGYIRSYAFVYADSVFDFVGQGLNSYTVSGVDVPGQPLEESHGASLTIVYEAPGCPYSQIDLAYGLDTFYHGWEPPYGPNSEVACVAFDPTADARTLQYTVIVAGAAQPEVNNATRPSGFWTASINAPDDTLPANLIGEPFANGIADPFNSTPGLEWDIFSGQIAVAAGDNYACFQVESPEGDEFPGGISGGWLNLTTAIPLATGEIGDRVWADYDGDGVQDANEPGLNGVTVTLTDGQTTSTAVTDVNGFYLFEGLPPGAYTVTVNPATGDLAGGAYTQTGDPDGGNDNRSQVTIGVGESNLEQDFGYQPLGSIGDTVWLDADGNGAINGGETGIPNVTVRLTDAANNVQTKVTDATGFYQFTDLPAGAYTVSIDTNTLPANLTPTYDPDGISTPHTATLLLGPGEDRDDIDFGYRSVLGSIGDTVWLDENNNGAQDAGEPGIPNVLVTLAGGQGGAQQAVTNASGFYNFVDLEPRTYTVRIDPATLPPGVGPTYDLDGIGSPNTARATLAAGQNRVDVDFGYVDILGSIGDTVWRDDNGNGVQDNSEPGIPNVTITLTDRQGRQQTAVTNGSGLYQFNDLPAGIYVIAVAPATLPPGVRQTYDLDGVATPHSATAALAQAEDRTDVDFGYQPLGSLGDTVWLDSNDNGVQDGGEAGIANVFVRLIYPNGSMAEQRTDNTGQYTFSDLPSGVYTVQVNTATLPEGLVPTYDLDGLGTPNSTQVTLAPAQNRTDVDFGYHEPPLAIDDDVPDAIVDIRMSIYLPVVNR